MNRLSRRSSRVLLALAVLAVASGIAWYLLSRPRPAHGADVHHESVYLHRDGEPVDDYAEADAVLTEVRHDLATRSVAGELDRLLRAALEAARADESASEPNRDALADLRVEEIQAVWQSDAGVLDVSPQGHLSVFDGLSDPADAPTLASGKRLRLDLSLHVLAWPREPDYTDHPEILVAQSQVYWWSAESELGALAEPLSKLLAAEGTNRIRERAAATGLAAPDWPPWVPRPEVGPDSR
jgi:hypothetical protein